MKKKIEIGIVIVVSMVIIMGMVYWILSNNSNVQIGETKTDKEDLKKEDKYVTFYGTVLDSLGIFEEVNWVKEVPGRIQITIQPEENEEIRKSADKIITYLKEENGNAYDPGTRVKVTYTGYVMETYPAQIDCISIEEVENKTISLYTTLLEDIIKQDEALNTDAKFIAIDFENFVACRKDRYSENGYFYRNLSKNEKQALMDVCKTYNENVIEANFTKLKEDGYFNEKEKRLDGILISVNNMENTNRLDKVILRMQKYRSALGAIMPKYELDLIEGKDWHLKVVDTMIS